ncbi:hypothetical protein P9112_005194 [Eukaryota sp. TZLM1-RC]
MQNFFENNPEGTYQIEGLEFIRIKKGNKVNYLYRTITDEPQDYPQEVEVEIDYQQELKEYDEENIRLHKENESLREDLKKSLALKPKTVEVEKIVEKEVPVEDEKIVEKEVEVEKIVEVPVEKIVEVEKIVYINRSDFSYQPLIFEED